jgi:uncharacterized Zn finger protein
MEYICPKCNTVLPIPDDLLEETESILHCYNCGNIINPTEATSFDSKEIASIIRQYLNSNSN